MDKLTHRFINGEIITDTSLNDITNKVNDIIDANQTLLDTAEQIEDVKRAIENIPDSSAATLQIQKNKENINDLSKHLGMYSKRTPVAIAGNVAKNKILTTLPSGEVAQVAQQGWNISRINAEDVAFGDTVFLKMLSATGQNLMVEGAVLFAKLEGEIFYSLTDKTDAVLPESGMVQCIVGEDVGMLYVSHPASVDTLIVGRSEVGEAIAHACVASGLVVHEGLLCMEVEQDEED